MYILILILPFLNFIILSALGFFLLKRDLYKIIFLNLIIAWLIAWLALFEINIALSSCVILFSSFFDLVYFYCPFIFLFDELCSFMCIVVLSISILVHCYSMDYMKEDPFIIRFLSYLSLFTFFMLFLVTAGTVIQLFIGWEGVGLSSYLLINFWFTRIQAAKSALKAIVINRFGDIGLYGIIIILGNLYGSLDLLTLSILYNYEFNFEVNLNSDILFKEDDVTINFIYNSSISCDEEVRTLGTIIDEMMNKCCISMMNEEIFKVIYNKFYYNNNILDWLDNMCNFNNKLNQTSGYFFVDNYLVNYFILLDQNIFYNWINNFFNFLTYKSLNMYFEYLNDCCKLETFNTSLLLEDFYKPRGNNLILKCLDVDVQCVPCGDTKSQILTMNCMDYFVNLMWFSRVKNRYLELKLNNFFFHLDWLCNFDVDINKDLYYFQIKNKVVNFFEILDFNPWFDLKNKLLTYCEVSSYLNGKYHALFGLPTVYNWHFIELEDINVNWQDYILQFSSIGIIFWKRNKNQIKIVNSCFNSLEDLCNMKNLNNKQKGYFRIGKKVINLYRIINKNPFYDLNNIFFYSMFKSKLLWLHFKNTFFSLNLKELLGLCIILAAVGKSAQIGLHTWLPDATEGPTPVSALIHAATMVTAGIFVLIRFFWVLEHLSFSLLLISFLGSITVFFAGSIGSFQYDLKKVIAYSTCSQLGYMFFICGSSSFGLSLFHLINHAFFKALLFLGAGVIIHAILDEQDIRKMGNLWKRIPFVYLAMFISSLALIGIPFLSGFYSKDLLLESAFVNEHISIFLGYILCLLGILFTTIYSLRVLLLVFFNNPNLDKSNSFLFESTIFINIVLSILIFFSIIGGFLLKEWILINYSMYNIWLSENSFSSEFLFLFIKTLPFSLICFSIILINLFWTKIYFSTIYYHFFNQKWYFDLFYNNFIVWLCISFSYKVSFKIIDRAIFEQWGSFGVSNFINISLLLKFLSSGHIYQYIFIFWNFFIWIFIILKLSYHSLDIILLGLYLILTFIFKSVQVDILGPEQIYIYNEQDYYSKETYNSIQNEKLQIQKIFLKNQNNEKKN